MPLKFSKPRSNQMNYLSYQPAIRQTDTKGYQWQKVSQFVKSCQNERHLKSIYPEERRCKFLSGRREDEILIKMFLSVCRNQQLCLVSYLSLSALTLSLKLSLNLDLHSSTYRHIPAPGLTFVSTESTPKCQKVTEASELHSPSQSCPVPVRPRAQNSSEASSTSELHSAATRRLKYPLFTNNGLRGEKCCS